MQLAQQAALACLLFAVGATSPSAFQRASLAPSAAQSTSGSIGATTSGSILTIFTTIPNHPTADVPGYPGLHFFELGPNGTFSGVAVSPIGRWAVAARTATWDFVVIVDGKVVAKTGDPAPFAPGTYLENLGAPSVNDAGEVVFYARVVPSWREFIVKRSVTGNFTIVAERGTPIPALPGAIYNWFYGAVLLADGSVFVACYASPGGSMVVRGSELVIGPTSVPIGQPGGATATWAATNQTRYFHAGTTAERWIAIGQPPQLVVSGIVRIQEKQLLPSSDYTSRVATLLAGCVDSGGHWLVQGANLDGKVWLARDGKVLAESGGPIPGSSGERFAQPGSGYVFTDMAGDGGQRWAIVASTDAPATNNQVILTDSGIAVREGDTVDLDGNGLFDDNAFLSPLVDPLFHQDRKLGFAGDGTLFFVAEIRDAGGAHRGYGFFRRLP